MPNDDKRDLAPQSAAQPPAEAERCATTGASSRRLASTLMRATLAGTSVSSKLTEEQRDDRLGAALDLAASFRPQDGVQGALAGIAANLFFSTTDLTRRAQNSDLPPQLVIAFTKAACRAADTFASVCEAIARRQGAGAAHQRVVVEHVTVAAGANAVIGAVAPGQGGGGRQ